MTQLRCKPGDLAILAATWQPTSTQPAIQIVEVMELLPVGRLLQDVTSGVIVILSDPTTWRVRLSNGETGVAFDRELRPIHPDGDPLEVPREEAVPA